jgi:REP element-mobilizing transposase RayT
MRRRHKRYEHATLFISGNVSHRVPLFRVWPKANEIFLENLEFYRNKYGFQLRGYVLMPDHYHLLVTLKEGTSLANLLRDFKSSVGKQVVEGLSQSQRTELLERFRLPSSPRRRKDARYRVLQYDNYIVEVFTPRILCGKLEYMHSNPVKKGLTERPGDWEYSSWSAYELDKQAPLRVDRFTEL